MDEAIEIALDTLRAIAAITATTVDDTAVDAIIAIRKILQTLDDHHDKSPTAVRLEYQAIIGEFEDKLKPELVSNDAVADAALAAKFKKDHDLP